MFQVFVLSVLLVCAYAKVDFTGHRLISVQARNAAEVDILRGLEENIDLRLDFWTEPSLVRPTDIHVPPASYGELRRTLKKAGIQFHTTNENIQDLIDEEDRSMRGRSTLDPAQNYLSYDQILTFVKTMASQHADMVKWRSIGNSYEGRQLIEVRIAQDLNARKQAVYLECGTHAREWLSISTCLNLIQTLVSAQGESMLAKYDWYLVPLHNPDGYEYTRAENRVWRKNRQEVSYHWWYGECGGIDLNRNWDANHGGEGSSSDTCSDTHHGGIPFSAPETDHLQQAIQDVRGNQELVAFFSIHCYSQLLLVPYGYTRQKPSDYDELTCVGEKMMTALRAVHGKKFVVGTPPDLLYVASGGAYDWVKDSGTKYSYTYELRPSGNQGTSGFIQPATEILPTAEETIASLREFAEMNLGDCK